MRPRRPGLENLITRKIKALKLKAFVILVEERLFNVKMTWKRLFKTAFKFIKNKPLR